MEAADDGEREDRWPDRVADDGMAPPRVPCECWCLHCHRTFTSDQMWFQRVIGDPQGFEGFWMCPTANCGGAGFTFDIYPTDPDHPANEGWHDFGEDEEEGEETAGEETGGEYDPSEPKYEELDEMMGDEEDDDLEGEEWKHGLQPGERPAEDGEAEAEARRRWEEEQRKYDAPDERPREVDWSKRPDREGGGPRWGEDEIPF